MKTIKNLLLIGIFSTISVLLSGQTVLDFSKLFNETRANNPRSSQATYDGIEGSPYLQDEFCEGKLILDDQTIYNGVLLRYNAYEQQMEFKHQNGTVLVIDDPEKFKEFNINEQRFIYKAFKNSNSCNKAFLEVLESGEITLTKKYTIELKDAVPPAAYKDAQPAKFLKKPNTYYLLGKGQIEEITSEKKLLEALNDKKSELKSFIKKNKLKVRKEEDLKEIVSFYNSI